MDWILFRQQTDSKSYKIKVDGSPKELIHSSGKLFYRNFWKKATIPPSLWNSKQTQQQIFQLKLNLLVSLCNLHFLTLFRIRLLVTHGLSHIGESQKLGYISSDGPEFILSITI